MIYKAAGIDLQTRPRGCRDGLRQEIALVKSKDPAFEGMSLECACKTIAGSARSLGIEITSIIDYTASYFYWIFLFFFFFLFFFVTQLLPTRCLVLFFVFITETFHFCFVFFPHTCYVQLLQYAGHYFLVFQIDNNYYTQVMITNWAVVRCSLISYRKPWLEIRSNYIVEFLNHGTYREGSLYLGHQIQGYSVLHQRFHKEMIFY